MQTAKLTCKNWEIQISISTSQRKNKENTNLKSIDKVCSIVLVESFSKESKSQ